MGIQEPDAQTCDTAVVGRRLQKHRCAVGEAEHDAGVVRRLRADKMIEPFPGLDLIVEKDNIPGLGYIGLLLGREKIARSRPGREKQVGIVASFLRGRTEHDYRRTSEAKGKKHFGVRPGSRVGNRGFSPYRLFRPVGL
jgi:hypothetical protein